jgi:succinylarginine dihydrolase
MFKFAVEMNCAEGKMTLDELDQSRHEVNSSNSSDRVWRYLKVLASDENASQEVLELKNSINNLAGNKSLSLVVRISIAEGIRSQLK